MHLKHAIEKINTVKKEGPKQVMAEKTTKDVKQMIREPASKDWFAKHGLPKGLGPQKRDMAKKMSPIVKQGLNK